MPLAVAQHSLPVLHPGVRSEATVPHPNAHAYPAPRDAVALEHPVEGDCAHEAERPKEPELRGASYRKRKRFGAHIDGRVVTVGRRLLLGPRNRC